MPQWYRVDDIRECAYCGSTANLTRDHIPPKSLFNRPRPSNLITVDACRTCNASFEVDDEYFWLTTSSRAGQRQNGEAVAASIRAVQHISREQAAGFRSAFLASIGSVELNTPSGLYAGARLGYDVSFTRLNRVAARITRGLFRVMRKTVLPAQYVATARALDGFTPEASADLQQLLGFVGSAQVHSIGRVFSYRFRSIPDDANSALALFEIYESTAFLGLTIKRSDNVWSEWV
jgi:HNH endonuclease